MLAHEFISASDNELHDISYDCIKSKEHIVIPDNLILKNIDSFHSRFRSHWWHVGNEDCGLNYYGITIVLNKDLTDFISALNTISDEEILSLQEFCLHAQMNGQNIVHFGV